MNFDNKVVLITWAARWIWKSTALTFGKNWANVDVAYNTSKEEAEKVVAEIENLWSRAISIKCDISQEEDVSFMFTKIIETFWKIDVVVNNAGIVIDTPLLQRSTEERQKTININLIWTFLCCKYAAKIMLDQKQGKIINISSTNAINLFSPDAVDYDASKAGINIMTKDFAKELAPYVQVNAIAPWRVDTEMNKDLPEDFIKEQTEKIFMKRFAKPQEIANVALFLASDEASYINWSVILVDWWV